MYVTTYLSIPKGHEDIDFVDITTDAEYTAEQNHLDRRN